MLDYYAWRTDSSEIKEPQFDEVIAISAIKNADLYRLTLKFVFSDISDDAFIMPNKFVGLAVMVLNLCLKIKEEGAHFSDYCQADDLNACMMLLKKKMDTMLVDAES